MTFLNAIAPELVNLLRAVADYLDPTLEDFGPDPEDDTIRIAPPHPRGHMDERGAWVPLDPEAIKVAGDLNAVPFPEGRR